jgi:deoxycytidine triphosphate deaminase
MATETKKTELKEDVKVNKVRIRLEKRRDDAEDVYVAVNGKSYLIKRGEYVEVPESVAEVLQHKEEMIALAEVFEEQAKAGASK